MWLVMRMMEASSWGAIRYVCESRRGSYAGAAFVPRLVAVGVGLSGDRCGGARGLAGSSYCSVALEASCIVREPSDQRKIRTLDWI